MYMFEVMYYETLLIHLNSLLGCMGRDLGGLSPKIWGGGNRPCIRPPNIWRSSVTGCMWKYEL